MNHPPKCTPAAQFLAAFATALAAVLLFSLAGESHAQNPANPAPAATAQYTITDLGVLPSIADDVSPGLSRSGAVSLWTSSPAGGAIHAGVWDKGKFTDLGTPSGYANSIARAVNDRGDVVGWVVTSKNPVDSQATTRGFLYDGRSMRLLDTLGGKNSRAIAINKGGQVAGIADTANGSRHAFLLSRRKMADLGTLPGGVMSIAMAINAGGAVAGAADAGQGARHAVVWKDGKISDLGTLPGGRVSYATALNDHGQVAGYAETPDGYHAFLWSGGAMQDLGTLKEDPSSAWAMNNLGQVVGTSGMGKYILHAFLWQNGKMADLNALIPAGTGWVLTRGVAINDSGEIVCLAHKLDHIDHALLLTPAAGANAD